MNKNIDKLFTSISMYINIIVIKNIFTDINHILKKNISL